MLPAFIRLIRPGEWVKNLFVLPALVFTVPRLLAEADPGDRAAVLWPLVPGTALAFAGFCLLSSGFYCLNDAIDAERDARHPRKRLRPIPSGAIPRRTAVVAGVILAVAGIGLGFLANVGLGVTLLLYAVLQVLYNAGLKRVSLVDVVAVAIGFGLRAAAGAVAIEVQISVWLLLCVFFLCLFLGFVKRLCDISAAAGAGDRAWRPPAGYADPGELQWLLGISAVLSVMTYLMYTLSPHAREQFGGRALGLALLTPLVLIAIHRFYLRALAGLSDSPLDALREDRTVLITILLYVAGTLACLYVPAVEQAIGGLIYVAGDAGRS